MVQNNSIEIRKCFSLEAHINWLVVVDLAKPNVSQPIPYIHVMHIRIKSIKVITTKEQQVQAYKFTAISIITTTAISNTTNRRCIKINLWIYNFFNLDQAYYI